RGRAAHAPGRVALLPRDKPPTVDPPIAVEHQSDGLWVDAMLLDQNARRERLDRIVLEYRHSGLKDDRTGVELLHDEMHRGTRHADAVVQSLALGVESAKR